MVVRKRIDPIRFSMINGPKLVPNITMAKMTNAYQKHTKTKAERMEQPMCKASGKTEREASASTSTNEQNPNETN